MVAIVIFICSADVPPTPPKDLSSGLREKRKRQILRNENYLRMSPLPLSAALLCNTAAFAESNAKINK